MRAALVSLACFGALAIALLLVVGVGLIRLHSADEAPVSDARISAEAAHARTADRIVAIGASRDPSAPKPLSTSRSLRSDVAAALPSGASAPATHPDHPPLPPPVQLAAGEGKDDAVLLAAAQARLEGPGFRLTGQGVIGWWDDPSAVATWGLTVASAGVYRVQLVYSCGGEGRDFVVTAAGRELTGRSHSTGGWDRFTTLEVGAVRLDAGPTTIAIHPSGPGGALMNLKEVRLLPAHDDGSTPVAQSTLVLSAESATIHGNTLRLEGDHERHLAFWTDAGDYPQWAVHVPRGGRYRVRLTFGSDPGTGGPIEVNIGGKTLRSRTHSTGNFWRFETLDAGSVKLDAGEAALTIRSGGPMAVALMNLRRVTLVPEDH